MGGACAGRPATPAPALRRTTTVRAAWSPSRCRREPARHETPEGMYSSHASGMRTRLRTTIARPVGREPSAMTTRMRKASLPTLALKMLSRTV